METRGNRPRPSRKNQFKRATRGETQVFARSGEHNWTPKQSVFEKGEKKGRQASISTHGTGNRSARVVFGKRERKWHPKKQTPPIAGRRQKLRIELQSPAKQTQQGGSLKNWEERQGKRALGSAGRIVNRRNQAEIREIKETSVTLLREVVREPMLKEKNAHLEDFTLPSRRG